jgi:hypothetical protein
MNLTAGFLGELSHWSSAWLSLSSVHGLWGGYILVVAASGAATIRLIDPGSNERRYEIDLGAEAAHVLLRLCVEHDLLAIDQPERTSLIPDETQSIFQLGHGRRTFTIVSWSNDPPHAGLAAIGGALLALRQHTMGREPSYAGPDRNLQSL